MSTPVFIYNPAFPVKHWITREFVTNSYGDGYYQSITSEAAYSRADGMGNNSSHRGLNHFLLNFSKAKSGNNQLAWNVYSFILTRLDNNNEPFYFYNPAENLSPDAGGNNTVGRYLVKLANPNEVLSWEYYRPCMYNFGSIELVECRS
jgi:hypothetical protein